MPRRQRGGRRGQRAMIPKRQSPDSSSESSTESLSIPSSASSHEAPFPAGVVAPFENADEQRLFDQLSQLKWEPTHWLNLDDMVKIGLREEMERLAVAGGFGSFLATTLPSYRLLTLEFLATAYVETEQGDVQHGLLKFRLGNQRWQATFQEINNLFQFGFPTGAVTMPMSEVQDFWFRITGIKGWSHKSKASHIVHPILRIFQKFISETIFYRGDSRGVVRIDELLVLRNMCIGAPTNFGALLANQLERLGYQQQGSIRVGGLITPFIVFCKIDVTCFAETHALLGIDLTYLRQCHILTARPRDTIQYLIFRCGIPPVPLPDVARISLADEVNWVYNWLGTYNVSDLNLSASSDSSSSSEPVAHGLSSGASASHSSAFAWPDPPSFSPTAEWPTHTAWPSPQPQVPPLAPTTDPVVLEQLQQLLEQLAQERQAREQQYMMMQQMIQQMGFCPPLLPPPDDPPHDDAPPSSS